MQQSGLAGLVGAQQALGQGYAANVAAPKEPDTLNAMLVGLDRELAHAHSVLARVTDVADKLLGGMPRAIEGNSGETPEPGSLVQRLKMRQQRLFSVLSQIDEQVARIGNAI